MDYIYYLFSNYYHNILMLNSNMSSEILELVHKKFIHTFGVILNAKEICFKENIDSRTSTLIEIAALFHDIGRFSQIIEYGTFNDTKSFDHAEMSSNILFSMQDDILNIVSVEELNDISSAIYYHNKIEIPNSLNSISNCICKVLKDADKLNILSINIKSPFKSFNTFLSNNEDISSKCIESILNCSVVKNADVISVLDNNVKLLSWIFDFNFKTSIDIYLKEDFLNILTDTSKLSNNDSIKTMKNIKGFLIKYIKKEPN